MCVFVVYNMMSDDNSGFTQVNCVPVVLRDFVHAFSNLCRQIQYMWKTPGEMKARGF